MKQTKIITSIATTALATLMVGGFFTPVSVAAETTAVKDEAIATTYQHDSGVINAPAVIVDGTDKVTVESAISAEQKPSNLILRVDGQCNVLSASGEVIDSFDNLYTAMDHKIIPVLQVESEGAVVSVCSYLLEKKTILDIAVMSTNPNYISQVKEIHPSVRGILEVKSVEDNYDVVKQAQSAGAITVIVPQSLATVSNVKYWQGMFKTVWVRAEGTDSISLSDAVFSGAYGVIANDAKAVYDFYSALPENTYTRTPFVVAHRGDVTNCNENSLSGVVSSAEGGATHVELDVHVTKDKKLVVMHDDTLTRTTTGTGTISNMTLAAIQKYQIDYSQNTKAEPEKIPTFEESVEEILKTDMIFVLELKCTGREIVTLVKESLEDPALAPIYERMVVISFHTDQLDEMKKVLPQVPTANLNSATSATFKSVLGWMGQYNTGIDAASGNITKAFHAQLRDRGIIPWTYTHAAYNDVKSAQKQGLIGLTTNDPTSYYEEVETLGTIVVKAEQTIAVGEKVTVHVNPYGAWMTPTEGTLVFVEETDKAYKMVASVEIDGYTYFTQVVTKEKEGDFLTGLFGCNASLSGGAALVMLLGVGVLLRKKER